MKLLLLSWKTVAFLLLRLLQTNSSSPAIHVYNGLAATPPMGWIPWTRFKCETNCDAKPSECINEGLFMEMANRLADDGYLEAGYTQLNVDDCWSAMQRGGKEELVADPQRFPHGVAWLAEYAHKRGLKFGIYANYGDKTCMGFPGSKGHLKLDATTFASWGVDMVKMDGCFSPTEEFDEAYPQMAAYLNATGREILYSCSWPYYLLSVGKKPDYRKISKYCNLWRNFNDIENDWKSLLNIVRYYESHQADLARFHGPGHWNDPDMLVIGNPGLSIYQARTQMALWCLWSAPLMMSNDLRNIRPEFRSILLNKDLIAVDQDPLGRMGQKVHETGQISVFTKPVMPADSDTGATSMVIVIFNRGDISMQNFGFKLSDFGLQSAGGYSIRELFEGTVLGVLYPSSSLSFYVRPNDVVVLKATLVPAPEGADFEAMEAFTFNAVAFVVFVLFVIIFYKLLRKRLRSFFKYLIGSAH